MIKYSIFFLFLFAINSVCFSQKCERPDKVFIEMKFENVDYSSADFINNKLKTFKYAGEVFRIKNAPIQITKEEYSNINLYSLNELREMELKIMRCEVAKADNTVYVDLNINDVFKKIYFVFNQDASYYKVLVHWIDGIE